jgi:hypothetical protein
MESECVFCADSWGDEDTYKRDSCECDFVACEVCMDKYNFESCKCPECGEK